MYESISDYRPSPCLLPCCHTSIFSSNFCRPLKAASSRGTSTPSMLHFPPRQVGYVASTLPPVSSAIASGIHPHIFELHPSLSSSSAYPSSFEFATTPLFRATSIPSSFVRVTTTPLARFELNPPSRSSELHPHSRCFLGTATNPCSFELHTLSCSSELHPHPHRSFELRPYPCLVKLHPPSRVSKPYPHPRRSFEVCPPSPSDPLQAAPILVPVTIPFALIPFELCLQTAFTLLPTCVNPYPPSCIHTYNFIYSGLLVCIQPYFILITSTCIRPTLPGLCPPHDTILYPPQQQALPFCSPSIVTNHHTLGLHPPSHLSSAILLGFHLHMGQSSLGSEEP